MVGNILTKTCDIFSSISMINKYQLFMLIELLPEALNNRCQRCNVRQQVNSMKLMRFMAVAYPNEWQHILDRYTVKNLVPFGSVNVTLQINVIIVLTNVKIVRIRLNHNSRILRNCFQSKQLFFLKLVFFYYAIKHFDLHVCVVFLFQFFTTKRELSVKIPWEDIRTPYFPDRIFWKRGGGGGEFEP